jgi:RNA polymerase sigma-70 factor (ECF subfamily)
MDERERLAEQFEANRSHLRAVAYRMLGSLVEAEDAVQETWLRVIHSDMSGVENLGGWLTTVVARICLDQLRARHARREESLEDSLPERFARHERVIDPEQEALLAESVGQALLVVLDTLTPAERLAFVLHDIFAMPFDEIASVVDRSEAATRQLASRARRRVVGVVVAQQGRLFLVLQFTIANGRIAAIDAVGDPVQLHQLQLSVLEG